MPRPPSLKKAKSRDEIWVGDQVMVQSMVLGNEPCLAQIIEIKQIEEESNKDDAQKRRQFEEMAPGPSTSAMEVDNGFQEEEKSNSGSQDASSNGNQKTRYYVHYVGTDRRLDEWIDQSRIAKAHADPSTIPSTPGHSASKFMTRSQRRINEEFLHMQMQDIHMQDAYTRKLEMEHEQRTKVKNVDKVQFGEWEIDTWYFSPFPLSMVINRSKLYFCEFCLWYTPDQEAYTCHVLHKCKERSPPGHKVYEDGNLAVWEVKGRRNKEFCQSLCLLSKLFLDHKTLYYDVEGFLFYVLCELAEDGQAHTVGHFSKELYSPNNLACIMVLPPYQRNGYGKLLIQISYCLSEREGIVGTPEKPLSDLGKVSYRSYWWWVLIGVLDREMGSGSVEAGNISVNELSRLSGIHADDIVDTFKTLQLIKYWHGDHVVRISRKIISQIKQLHVFHPPRLLLRKSAVRWMPKNGGNLQFENGKAREKFGALNNELCF